MWHFKKCCIQLHGTNFSLMDSWAAFTTATNIRKKNDLGLEHSQLLCTFNNWYGNNSNSYFTIHCHIIQNVVSQRAVKGCLTDEVRAGLYVTKQCLSPIIDHGAYGKVENAINQAARETMKKPVVEVVSMLPSVSLLFVRTENHELYTIESTSANNMSSDWHFKTSGMPVFLRENLWRST